MSLLSARAETARGIPLVAATVPSSSTDVNGPPRVKPATDTLAIGEEPRRVPLRINFAWTFAGNVLYAVSQWVMLIVLAKATSAEIVGRFALGLALSAPVVLFFNLQLRSLQATDAKQEARYADYYWLRTLGSSLALMTIIGMAALMSFDRSMKLTLSFIGLAKVIEAQSDLYYGLFQKNERHHLMAVSLVSRGIFNVSAFSAVLLATHSLNLALLALVVGNGMIYVLFDRRNGRVLLNSADRDTKPSRARIVTLAKTSIPLGFVALLVSLLPNIPRYFLERIAGKSQLGYFAALAYLLVAGRTVVLALGQAAAPRLSRYYVRHDARHFLRVGGKLLAVSALLGFMGIGVAILVGRQLLEILYTGDYARYQSELILVMLAGCMTYVAASLSTLVMVARRIIDQVWVYTSSVVVTVATAAMLVPSANIRGAAWATVAGASIQLVGNAIVLARALRLHHRTHPTITPVSESQLL